jgi:2-polyprenyl-6-methoxyphenol hydroxylase-like FAD-dependent oxidoreductase
MSSTPIAAPKVLIIGTGLGGLCLAQGLTRAGIEVELFERDATPWDRPQGYRLHLEADALNSVREILTPEGLALFNATAMLTAPFTTILTTRLDVAKRFPTDDGQDPTHWPEFVSDFPVHANVDRATLREILLDGLADSIHFGKRFVSYESVAEGVTATFADGTTAYGDILVGADGVRSAVRAQRAPNLSIMDAGVQAIYGRIPWNAAVELLPSEALSDIFAISIDDRKMFLGLGVVKFPTEPGAASISLGRPGLLAPRADYVVCIVGGRHENFPHGHDELRVMPAAQLQDVALGVISEWPERARSVVAAADPDSFFSVGMYTSVPGELVPNPNVTLLGDAVHAMTPTLGRGANLAMRDGALLSRAIRAVAEGTLSLPDALAAYETELTRYGFEVVRESVQTGEQRMAQTPLPA